MTTLNSKTDYSSVKLTRMLCFLFLPCHSCATPCSVNVIKRWIWAFVTAPGCGQQRLKSKTAANGLFQTPSLRLRFHCFIHFLFLQSFPEFFHHPAYRLTWFRTKTFFLLSEQPANLNHRKAGEFMFNYAQRTKPYTKKLCSYQNTALLNASPSQTDINGVPFCHCTAYMQSPQVSTENKKPYAMSGLHAEKERPVMP